MEDTTLIVILTALFNLLGIAIQKVLDSAKAKKEREAKDKVDASEISKNDSDTISSLLKSVDLCNDNYQDLSEKHLSLIKKHTELESVVDNLVTKVNEKDLKITDLEERMACMIEVDAEKGSKIEELEGIVKKLKDENTELKGELEQNRHEFTRKINILVDENNQLRISLDIERERVNTLTSQMKNAGLTPNA